MDRPVLAGRRVGPCTGAPVGAAVGVHAAVGRPLSVLGLAEQVEASGADVLLLLPSSAHVDAVSLDRVMATADVECAAPRASFARWSLVGGVHR